MDHSPDQAETAVVLTAHRPNRLAAGLGERSYPSSELPRWGSSGVTNFRDLAEANASSDPLRSGLIYRSDALHRCRRPEIEQLAALRVRRILDLRAETQADAVPAAGTRTKGTRANDPWAGHTPTDAELTITRLFQRHGIVTVRIPMVKDDTARDTCVGPDELAEFYLDLAVANSGAIVLCMAEIIAGAADHEPLVIQGSTGTDRTGIVTALALALAGIDDRRIALDYARSATAEPETMIAFLRSIRQHYGSAQDFLVWGGADRSELDRCRSVFR